MLAADAEMRTRSGRCSHWAASWASDSGMVAVYRPTWVWWEGGERQGQVLTGASVEEGRLSTGRTWVALAQKLSNNVGPLPTHHHHPLPPRAPHLHSPLLLGRLAALLALASRSAAGRRQQQGTQRLDLGLEAQAQHLIGLI